MVAAEDERSVQKHISFMKKECAKREPNTDILRDSMKRTAAYRQDYCHKNTTEDVVTTFPSLRLRMFGSLHTSESAVILRRRLCKLMYGFCL